jgi:hypothetical protein
LWIAAGSAELCVYLLWSSSHVQRSSDPSLRESVVEARPTFVDLSRRAGIGG